MDDCYNSRISRFFSLQQYQEAFLWDCPLFHPKDPVINLWPDNTETINFSEDISDPDNDEIDIEYNLRDSSGFVEINNDKSLQVSP